MCPGAFVRGVPEGAGVVYSEAVVEVPARLDRVLGQVRHAVHGVVDADAVPVDGGRLRQLVLEVHEDLLALARADRRPGRDAVVEPGARRRLAGWQKLRLAGPGRAEERRVGKECVGTCRFRGWR